MGVKTSSILNSQALKTSGASVDIGGATPPAGAGYTLVSTDSTHGSWQNLNNVVASAAAPLVAPQPAVPSLTGFRMVEDLTFGSLGNIRNRADLVTKVEFVDSFAQVRGGGNKYGALTTAETIASSTSGQPVIGDGNTRWMREFTGNSMLMHVRPATGGASTVGPASAVNAWASSFMLKYKLDNGAGTQLGKDMVWETYMRIVPAATGNITQGLWSALWVAGNLWNTGPEIDVEEAYTTSILDNFRVFHSDVVGGTSQYNMTTDFWAGLHHGIPVYNQHDMRVGHKYTLVYFRDDTWKTYLDGAEINSGTLTWLYNGTTPTNLRFMIDWSWGNTAVGDISGLTPTVPASGILGTKEIYYTRVWLRD